MTNLKTISILVFASLVTAFQIRNKPYLSTKLPQKWTQLSRSENGYVVYQPCDGSTPTVEIKNSNLLINWQLESDLHTIKAILQTSDSTFKLDCDNANLDISVKWLNKEHLTALWKFQYSGENKVLKWVMCPTKLKSRFPFVENPCPTGKIKEKTFLPIDID